MATNCSLFGLADLSAALWMLLPEEADCYENSSVHKHPYGQSERNPFAFRKPLTIVAVLRHSGKDAGHTPGRHAHHIMHGDSAAEGLLAGTISR